MYGMRDTKKRTYGLTVGCNSSRKNLWEKGENPIENPVCLKQNKTKQNKQNKRTYHRQPGERARTIARGWCLLDGWTHETPLHSLRFRGRCLPTAAT